METMVLLGTGSVEHAGREIAAASERMARAASEITEAVRRFEVAVDRLEVLAADAAARGEK